MVALFLTACTSLVSQREGYVIDYQAGNFDQAEAKVSCLLDKKSENDEVWLRLDRAMAEFAAGKSPAAIDDFNAALERLDYYNQCGLLEILGKTLFTDRASPWRGDDYEQLLVRLYFALALLQNGDESNAYAILRQAEEWTQTKQAEYAQSRATCHLALPANKITKYLFALLLNKKGEKSSAEILLRQTEDPTLALPAPDAATVVILCHNGMAPYKYSKLSPASQASAFALEYFLNCHNSCHNTMALSTLAGIPLAELADRPYSYPVQTVAWIDGCERPLTLAVPIADEAVRELYQKRPLLIAQGVARLALRRGIVAAAQAHDPNVGQLVDLGMLIANLCTKADIRSWTLLPRQIELAATTLCPGPHTFTTEIALPYGQKGLFTSKLRLKKGDLCVIHIFNNQPGLTQVLIPQHFQENS